MARLRPTLRVAAARAARYRRPGGPWDLPDLDTLLRPTGPAGEAFAARLRTTGSASGPVPGRAALVADGHRLDRHPLEAAVAVLAGGLHHAGVRAGDPVVWQLPNGVDAVLLYRACWRLRAVAVPVHPRAGGAELDHLLGVVLAGAPPRVTVSSAGLPLAARAGAVVLSGPRRADVELAGRPLTEGSARPTDLAALLLTAGSTGRPKAVLHTHRSLAAKAVQMPQVHGLDADDVVLMPAPLAHISGLLNGVLVPQVAGMTSVLMDRWSPAEALELIEAEHVSFMVGPPTFFLGLMADPGFTTARVASLRLVSTGGAGVTTAFVAEAGERLGAYVKRSYGSTEAPTVATAGPTDHPVRAGAHDGRAVGDAELRVVDPTTGRTRPAGQEGELWVRGPELFAGYADPADTAAAVARGGWFRTGDLATVGADGWLTITGRLKDVIIRGGENVAAAAVEAVLEAHPTIEQAVVVGIPDDRLGERVAALVVTAEPFDLAACRAWCAAQGAGRLLWPEVVERVATIDDVPVLAAGKPDKAAVARRLAGR